MSARYPLWCVDTGEICDAQYRGPWGTEAEAAGNTTDPDDAIRRCRRVLASEIGHDFTDFMEGLDALALDGEVPDGAWANFDDGLVTARPTARAAFKAWADTHLVVKAFVCEGDEPTEGAS